MPQIAVPFRNLDLLLLIGRGSYGRVYMGMFRPSGEDVKVQVAVKVPHRCAHPTSPNSGHTPSPSPTLGMLVRHTLR